MLAEMSDAAFFRLSLLFRLGDFLPLSWPFQIASIWAGLKGCFSDLACCDLNISAMLSVNVHREDRACLRDSISAVT